MSLLTPISSDSVTFTVSAHGFSETDVLMFTVFTTAVNYSNPNIIDYIPVTLDSNTYLYAATQTTGNTFQVGVSFIPEVTSDIYTLTLLDGFTYFALLSNYTLSAGSSAWFDSQYTKIEELPSSVYNIATASLSAYYIDSYNNTFDLTSNNQCKWVVNLLNTDQSYLALSANGIPYTSNTFIDATNANPLIISASPVLSATGAICNIRFYHDDIAIDFRQPSVYTFKFYPEMKYTVTEDQLATSLFTFTARYEAYVDSVTQSVDPTSNITWWFSPTATIRSIPVAAFNYTTIDGEQWAYTNSLPFNSLSSINIVYDHTSYLVPGTNYVWGLNSFKARVSSDVYTPVSGWWSGTYVTPYKDLSSSTSEYLTGLLTTVNETNTYKNIGLNLYTYLPGTTSYVYKTTPTQLIQIYSQNIEGVTLKDSNGNIININDVIPTNNIATYNSVSPMTLEFIINETTTVPRVCSFQIGFSALSAGLTNYELAAVPYTLCATYVEHIDDNFLQPIMTVNYEPSSTTNMYRPSASTWWNLTAYNNSIVPTSTYQMSGSFYITISNTSLNSIEATLSCDLLDTSAYIITSIPASGNYSIILEGRDITFPELSGTTFTKLGNQIDVTFYDFMPTAVAFIYPTSAWDSSLSAWFSVDETNTPGPCMWGHCHTEIFNLSAPPYTGSTYYWEIKGLEPELQTDNINAITAEIPSTDETSIHNVTLQIVTSSLPYNMPVIYYSDTDGASAYYLNYLDASISPTTASGPITSRSFDDFISINTDLKYNPNIAPITSIQLSGSISITEGLPVEIDIPNSTFSWQISTLSWIDTVNTNNILLQYRFGVDDIGDVGNIVKGYIEYANIGLTHYASISSKDSRIVDFCNLSDTQTTTISVYPFKPYIYTSNYYVITSTTPRIYFENIIPYNSNMVNAWVDRDNTVTSVGYLTNFTADGTYTICASSLYLTVNEQHVNTSCSNNIITVLKEFDTYDSDINRIIGLTQLELPKKRNEILIGTNEWLIADNFNACINNIETNLTYLRDMSKLYDQPPSMYYGWLGTLNEFGNRQRFNWRVNLPYLSYNYNRPDEAIDGAFSNLRDIAVSYITGRGDNMHVVSNSTAVYLMSSNYLCSVVSMISSKGVNDPFIDITAVGIDSNFSNDHRIYILDSSKHRVMVFRYNFILDNWTLLYSWGGLGGLQAKNKFYNPKDMLIDDNDIIWIVDTDNLCIKQYSRSGDWIRTITDNNITQDTKPISMAISDSGEIHLLSSNGTIHVFDSNYQYKENYTLNQFTGSVFKSITRCIDGGFFYILSTDKVFKITQDGKLAGIFANEFDINTFTNLYQDSNRNIYITYKNGILKYIDKLQIVNLREDVDSSMWPLSTLQINKDEYQQDWVFNKSFARLWDNLELFRRSIIGKFDYNIISVDGIDTYKPIVRSFRPEEYAELPWTKDDLYIGVNEKRTADVINRSFNKVYDCIETLMELIGD